MNLLTKFCIIIFSSVLLTACGSEEESSTEPSQAVMKIAPVADVGTDISTDENTVVTLDGSNSSDSDGSIVEYLWELDSGAYDIALNGNNQSIATFTAPDVDADIQLVFELTVTDNDGISSKDYLNVTILRVNEQPVANAPVNVQATGDELVTIDGSNSHDPDGAIASYAWTQTSGTNVTILNADQAIASFTAPNANAQLGFQLTVTDNEGAANTQAFIVTTVEQTPEVIENQFPIARVQSTVTVNGGEQVVLNGTASSDPDGSIINYNWAQTSGSPSIAFTKAQSSQSVTSFIAPNVETQLIFQLSVTDDDGATSTNSVTITINEVIAEPENQAPYAYAGDNITVEENTLVTLSGSASNDSDGTIVGYYWTQRAGSPTVAINTPTSITASFTAPEVTEQTTLTFDLVVSDNDGAEATDYVYVTVEPAVEPNQAPTISGVPASTVTEGKYFSFTPESADLDGDVLTFTISNLPLWATFDTTSGTISGTPIAADIGFYDNITIVVSDGETTATLPGFSIDVLAAPVAENPLLNDVAGFSISMGTSQDTVTHQGTISIGSDAISSTDLMAAEAYYISVTALDINGNNILQSNSESIGYRIYAGTSSDTLYPVMELVGGSNAVFAINEPIANGTYYLSIVVFESNGFEGSLSDIIQLNIM